MSIDTLPAIPEFLQKQKEEAAAARAARLQQEEERARQAEAENLRSLCEAVKASVGPELYPLLSCQEPIGADTALAWFELSLPGHRPIRCRFERRSMHWERDTMQGGHPWEVEIGSVDTGAATLGEALLLADRSAPTSSDDDIPF